MIWSNYSYKFSPIKYVQPEEELSESYQSSPEDSLHYKEGPINEGLSTELSNDEVSLENSSRDHVQIESIKEPIKEVLSTELSNDDVSFENLSHEHVQIELIKEPIEPQINSEEKIQQEKAEYEPLIDQKSQKLGKETG